MSDTPKTDVVVTGNSDPGADEYENLAFFARTLERQNRELACILGNIINDLPTKRDWLDPFVEKAARAALERNK